MQSSKIAPFTVFFENSEEFHVLKSEVFTQGAYYFETENRAPRIIDAGAHLGLSTLYFKKLFPAAHITAIEPNPRTFKVLEKNIFENQLDNVKAYQVALGEKLGVQEFFLDESSEEWFSTAGFHPRAWNGMQQTRSITVETLPLAHFLDQPIDFLKMDIEGAEQKVLIAAQEKIHFINEMIVEFHPVADQSLAKLVEFLEENRFRVQVWKDGDEVSVKRAKGLVYLQAINNVLNR